jgi:DSF synthase
MTQVTTMSFSLPAYNQLVTNYDTERKAIWQYFNPAPRPAFTSTLLKEIVDLQKRIGAHLASARKDSPQIHYLVTASASKDVYSLGGDLDLFSRLIRSRDRNGLSVYARLCIDCVHGNATGAGNPALTTIALVQGAALGGGFEAALSANVLIAEKGAQFGFPEILFNLFAGMGAYSLLVRRLDRVAADRIMRSGRQYTAEELHEMGLVDVLAEKGEGVQAVNEFIRRHSRSRNGLNAIEQVRQRLFPLTYAELDDIVSIWVDAAMRLTERDLRTMDRLVAAQGRLLAANHQDSGAVPEVRVA